MNLGRQYLMRTQNICKTSSGKEMEDTKHHRSRPLSNQFTIYIWKIQPCFNIFECQGVKLKVETPIHDSIRELITWECKEHGVHIMNVLANLKGSARRWNLNFWRLSRAILHKLFGRKGVVDTYSWPIDLSKRKQRNNCEATQMIMARKVHVYFENWEFHLVTPPKCQKLPSSIPKTAHVKFRATSSSLSATLWCYYRGQN
jgi:hypothetical protein